MAQQRRMRPAVGVAAVGLGIGAGALGLLPAAAAEPPAAVRTDALTDRKKEIDDLTDQARVLAGRGEAARAKASLDLARQLAAEAGLPTAPPVEPAVPPPVVPTDGGTIQAVVFHPAEPAPPAPTLPPLPAPALPAPALPAPTLPAPAAPAPAAESPAVMPPPEVKPPTLFVPAPAAPTLVPTAPEVAPAPRPAAVPVSRPVENPLLPAVQPLNLTPGGPTVPPVAPGVGRPTPPAPEDPPVKLPSLATAAVGAALAAAPLPAQDPDPKQGPPPKDVAKTQAAPAVSKEQFDALSAEVKDLKTYRKSVEDLLQGKSDGPSKSVLDAGVLKRLSDLEAKLDGITRSLDALRESVGKLDTVRSSQSPPAPAPAPAVTKTGSKVRLVNDYPSELSLILNGASHRLKQGETKEVPVTAGSFTYELIADGAKEVTRTIRDDETVTLRIK